MFLFAVTHESIARRLDAVAVRELQIGEWIVTTATDEWLSSCDAGPRDVTVSEMPPFARSLPRSTDPLDDTDQGLLFGAARFIRHERAIEITRTLLGGRQLYHHVTARGDFLCATHVGLLRAAGVKLEENEGAMAELFVYRYITAPSTLFKGIDQLPAGARIRFEFDGRTWQTRSTRLYSPPPPHAATRAEHAELTRNALRDTIQALRPARDRVRVLASGGIDSSILFKLADAELGISETYSTGYPFEDDEQNVEKRYALTAAEALRVRHRYFVPDLGQFLRAAIDVVSIGEEPVIFTQSVLLLLLFRDGLPPGDAVVVSGQGADGLHGLRLHHVVGNIERFKVAHPWLSLVVHPQLWSTIMRPMLRFPAVAARLKGAMTRIVHDERAIDVLTSSRWDRSIQQSDPDHVLWSLGVTGSEEWARQRFSATRQRVIANRARVVESYAGRDVLDVISLLDFLSDVSASQGIWSKLGESARKVVYYPFNARQVIDCAFSAPWEIKLAAPKAILRDVARAVGVPELILNRPKANFNITAKNWAAPGGAFEALVPIAASVWGEKEVREIQMRSRSAHTFWTMLNYAVWKRVFIDGQPIDSILSSIQTSPRP